MGQWKVEGRSTDAEHLYRGPTLADDAAITVRKKICSKYGEPITEMELK